MTEVKLEDLREGDVVDVVLRGVRVTLDLEDYDRPLGIIVTAAANMGELWLTRKVISDATITRRDPPIEKGSTVVMHGVVYEVRATSSTYAWLLPLPDQNQPDLFVTAPISNLTLVSKGPKS